MTSAKTNLLRIWKSHSLSIAFLGYLLITIIATTQGLTAGLKVYVPGGRAYIDYNNFRIFKFSFYHLIHNQDIYRLFPDDHWDLYKYSPAFALCFGFLSWMPDIFGLFLWNMINSFCLLAGIRLLPDLSDEKKSFILLFCLLEMLLSIQNTQSNGLMAGLIVLAFAFAERRNYLLSTLCIVFSFYIKIYGALAFVMYLFYPGKLRLFGWSLFWMAFFALIPLVVVSGPQLLFLYNSWWHLLIDDRSASTGVSVMGIMVSWFHLPGAKNWVTLAGIGLFLLPLVQVRRYKELSFRFLYLASMLIWMVIFNHKAESPTYIIVMSGIGIWYWSQQPASMTDRVLLILSFLLITMSVSDLVPAPVRNGFIRPYGIKGVMAIVVWVWIVRQQLFTNSSLKPARR
ncbi:MAG TPA: glycosyltransferase family 87 protein [Puia sp.]|uniref:glycosyltransferase family 87 protein n=1 Tax=Puia sp. TaxID=2045100 RepID=UPI002C0A29B2|nr:glycosyltransferase family 87 protein [Puia sp.]HVU99238.1 glycosyltransferase family 87 protein [Puia sp.]